MPKFCPSQWGVKIHPLPVQLKQHLIPSSSCFMTNSRAVADVTCCGPVQSPFSCNGCMLSKHQHGNGHACLQSIVGAQSAQILPVHLRSSSACSLAGVLGSPLLLHLCTSHRCPPGVVLDPCLSSVHCRLDEVQAAAVLVGHSKVQQRFDHRVTQHNTVARQLSPREKNHASLTFA